MGQDQQTELRPLTVDFHEPGLAVGLGGEDRFTQAQGFWFQLSRDAKQKAPAPWGPGNPQALNRYSYVLENPLRYVDLTGHTWYLTAPQSQIMQDFLEAAAQEADHSALTWFVGGAAGSSALGWWQRIAENVGFPSDAFLRVVGFVRAAGLAADALVTLVGPLAWLTLAAQLRSLKDTIRRNTDPIEGIAIGTEVNSGRSYLHTVYFLNRGTGQAQSWVPGMLIGATLPASMQLGTATTFGGATLTRHSSGWVFRQDIPAIH